jgi:hypothetical protein
VPVGIGVCLGLAAGVLVARQLAIVVGVSVPAFAWPLALPAVLALAAVGACALPVARLLRRLTLTEILRAE